MLDIVDLEKGQEVAGSRGYYLKGAVRGAALRAACKQHMLGSSRGHG